MKTIYKYPLRCGVGLSQVQLPQGTSILSVQCQGHHPYFWALVDTDKPTAIRSISVVGTGWECPELTADKFIGTFQLEDGALIFHMFDLGESLLVHGLKP